MESSYTQSPNGSLWSALIGMAETLGALKQARHTTERDIAALHTRVSALESRVSTISSSPTRTPEKSGLGATLKRISRHISYVELLGKIGKMILLMLPRIAIVWALAQGWLAVAWRWLSALVL